MFSGKKLNDIFSSSHTQTRPKGSKNNEATEIDIDKEVKKLEKEVEQKEQLCSLDKAEQQINLLDAAVSVIEDSDDDVSSDPLCSLLTQKSTYKIAVIGTGAREAMLINSLSKSKFNLNIISIGKYVNPNICKQIKKIILDKNINNIVKSLIESKVDIVIIGSEEYIYNGLVDLINKNGITYIGPTSKQSIIGKDRDFMRQLLTKYDMDDFNPDYVCLTKEDRNKIGDYCRHNFKELFGDKYVVKHPSSHHKTHDIIMGVEVNNVETIEQCCNDMIDSKYGKCIIEEYLEGDEFSLVSFSDGVSLHHTPLFKTYKYLNEASSIITDGIGCVSMNDHKMPFLTDDDIATIHKVVNNSVMALQEETAQQYKGMIQTNFMKTSSGNIKVIEFKCIINDPEVINLLTILKSDFMEICLRINNTTLQYYDIKYYLRASCSIYMVPKGFPSSVEFKDREIYIDNLNCDEIICNDVSLAHPDDKITLNGERAVIVVNKAKTVQDAKNNALKIISTIHGPLMWNSDIANDIIGLNIIGTTSKFTQSTLDLFEDINAQITTNYNDKTITLHDGTNIYKQPKGYTYTIISNISDKANFGFEYQSLDDIYYTMGEELVNQCVNEAISKGTLPTTFIPISNIPKIHLPYYQRFMEGVIKTCHKHKCKVLDHKLDISSDIYIENRCNLTGIMNSYVSDSHKLISGTKMKPGDVIYGIFTEGLHSSDFIKIKELFNTTNFKNELSSAKLTTFLGLLYETYYSYYDEFNSYNVGKVDIKHIINIKNGFIDSVIKNLPDNLKMTLYQSIIKNNIPNYLRTIMNYKNMKLAQLLEHYNSGFIMMFIVSKKDTKKMDMINHLRRWKHIVEIGVIHERKESEVPIKLVHQDY